MVYRLSFLIITFTLGYASLLFNLYNLQIAKGDQFLVRAQSQYLSQEISKAERGTIEFTDKNGKKLPAVTNKIFPLIYGVPKVIEDPSEAAHKIAPILNASAEDLVKRFAREGDAYELLQRKADKEVSDQIESLEIKGIYSEMVPERFYPFGKLASHLLGFVAPNDTDDGEQGRYGVEEFYNDRLSGVSGEVKDRKISESEPGETIVLTIDPNIQLEAERILENLVQTYDATGGSVIVEDPKTGKILAMGSYPNFDPNSYSRFKIADFLNPATQKNYEPGSVFKIITMASALDAGKVEPDTTFNDTGKLVLNKHTITNWDLKAHGVVTMSNIIEKSLNTGAAFVERKLGEELFKDYVSEFGFGVKTGIDLPGELKGDLRSLSPNAPPVNYATASFGQGISVTPIQMINSFAAIANGGKLMKPYLNSADKPEVVRTIIHEDAARKVTQMMISAVDKAEVAKIKGYTIAGKTGTAQVPDLRSGGYTDKVINSYIGFGPTKDPQFVILIKLDEPAGAPLAGSTVVPAFRDMAQFMLNYYNVPPDRIND